jgi:lipopolysaccharide transport system permease protein
MSVRAEPEADARPWSLIIRPVRGLLDLRLGLLLQYRDLVTLFVRRDFVAVYKQTILGPLWHLVQPILTTVTFTIIFGNIARLPTDGLPSFLFYMGGTVIWTYFANCVTATSQTFSHNAQLFGKVYFPRIVVPVATALSNLIAFAIQFILFVALALWYAGHGYPVKQNWTILLTPVYVLMMACLGLGVGIVVSSLTTRYKDLAQLVAFGVHLFMYATPVIYPMSSISGKYAFILRLNPCAPIIEAFRFAYLGAGSVTAGQLLVSGATCVGILFLGLVLFSRVEQTFMDTV